MSGPKSYNYRLNRELRQRAAVNQQLRADALNTARQRVGQAQHRYAALKLSIESLKQRFPVHPIDLVCPELPPEPDFTNTGALENYSVEVSKLLEKLSGQLLAETRRVTEDSIFGAALNECLDLPNQSLQTASELLDSIASRAKQVASNLQKNHIEQRQTEAKQLIAQLSNLPLEETPVELHQLLHEYLETQTAARTEALASEIKYRLSKLAQHQANSSPETLGDSTQIQAAQILEETLQNLGYAVEPIRDTLFAEGGVLHFQRAEWQNYYVRMRVYPDQQQVNFNVVKTESTGDKEIQKQQDLQMEHIWCSENGLPHLADVLASRGLDLDRIRAVAAGQLPVQVVDSGSIDTRLRSGKKSSINSATVQSNSQGIAE